MKIYTDFDLASYNSYKIKAKCRSAYFPDNEADVISFFTKKSKFILIGSGHNIIFSKEFYEEPMLIFNGNFNDIKLNLEGLLEIEAGAMIWDAAQFALDNSLSGLEIFWDIPSSLGGAVVMNAGASGEEIKDVLVKVRYLDLEDMKVKEIHKSDINFEYRNSFFQRNSNKIVLKAWLHLIKGDPLNIKEKMELIKKKRWDKQPKEFPNAGSVFKRPPGRFVGPMIDFLGLKGFAIGGAKISEKHSGFIVNFNNATGKDILDLINFVQKKVFDEFGVQLEIEQRII